MDERERKGRGPGRVRQDSVRRQRPDRYAQRPAGGSHPPHRQRPGRRSSRARRRRRNAMIRWMIFIVLILAAIGGFLIWKRYGASNERADLEQYYELSSEDEVAVVVNNEVIRENDDEQAASEETEIPPAGKVYGDQYYIEYSVVRDNINKRFYWDPNENIMLYTLPEGNVTVEVGSNEYTDVNEKKSADYDILKTEGRTAYIALPFIQEYTNMEYEVYDSPARVVVTSNWGEIQTAQLRRDTQVR